MSGARSNKWKLVASALVALLASGTAAPRAFAQTPPRRGASAGADAAAGGEVRRGEAARGHAARGRRRRSRADDRRRRQADRREGGRRRRATELDAAALDAVRQFTFEPARKGDRAIPARIRYRYTFEPEASPVPPRPATPRRGGGRHRRGADAPRRRAPAGSKAESCPRGGDKPVAAATVTLLSDAGAAVGTTLAAEDGTFAFADVPPGSYRVRIEAEGFAAVDATEAVTSGEATAITYRLEAAKKKTDDAVRLRRHRQHRRAAARGGEAHARARGAGARRRHARRSAARHRAAAGRRPARPASPASSSSAAPRRSTRRRSSRAGRSIASTTSAA